jgi:exopolyphosphatase/guanosine-5'-triphosphate,3'-diphosphate pyrophosphatase
MHWKCFSVWTLGADRFAVIDIGSNSCRILVGRIDASGDLEVLASAGTPLRLVRDLATSPSLSEVVSQRTIDVLRGFQAIARGTGATRTLAVATAAVREASNSAEFVERLRCATGLDIHVVTGEVEARYAFLGAVYGSAANDGVLVDIGGGSVQLVRFVDRHLVQAWSLPLGALRLSDRYLLSDPPTAGELRRLQEYVRRTLRDARVPPLAYGEQLVGTGGTLRNLAKIDRIRRDYPIHRLHGYVLGMRDLADLVSKLASQSAAQRARIPGLNASRVDSIHGGAACAQVVLEAMGAPGLVVSGQGLREGVARAAFAQRLPPAAEVRRAAVDALVARFTSSDRYGAEQRVLATEAVANAVDPELSGEIREILLHAARLLDIGRSVDYYNRHEHTLSIVLNADLAGFSHRAVALLAAMVRLAGKTGASLKAFAPLIGATDHALLARAGAILDLGDAVARQAPPDLLRSLDCSLDPPALVLSAPWLHPWPLRATVRRVEQAFDIQVRVEHHELVPAAVGL